MRLLDGLVYKVRVGRKTYRLKTDFRDVLKMIEILGDRNLTEVARIDLALRAVVRRPPKKTKDQLLVFLAARTALMRPPKSKGEGEKMTDFDQDADMIRAAFRQAYGIDLYRARLHWTEFTELLNNLPSGTRYSDVLEIRARPLPEATKWNGKQRQALIEAKMKYGIEKTDEEIRKSYQRGVNHLAESLLRMAKGSEQADVGRES